METNTTVKTESALARIFEVCDRNTDQEAEKRRVEQDAILASMPEECRPATRENW